MSTNIIIPDEAIDEIATILNEAGLQNRLGLSLIIDRFEKSENEDLIEMVDSENRVEMRKPIQKCLVEDSVETEWRFDDLTIVAEWKCLLFRGDKGKPEHEKVYVPEKER